MPKHFLLLLFLFLVYIITVHFCYLHHTTIYLIKLNYLIVIHMYISHETEYTRVTHNDCHIITIINLYLFL